MFFSLVQMGRSQGPRKHLWLGSISSVAAILGQEILLRALNLMTIAPLFVQKPVVWEGRGKLDERDQKMVCWLDFLLLNLSFRV